MICCVRERPIRRDGNHLHNNSVPSTYPWSWLVTSSGEPTYVRRRPSPSRRASTTPRTAAAAGGALHVHSTVCAAITDPHTTYRSVVVALLCGGLYLLADTIARYYSHYSGYGFTRLSVHRRRCGRGSVCSGVRQRTPRHSSRTVLRSQRHYHHHYKPIGSLLMAPKNKQL